MPNDDKIYQAYMGQMGEQFQTQVKRRISWIVEQVGDYDPVWDVGCSQGITSILLAQQGKQVTGIDIQPESIQFAQDILEKEYPELQDNLKFVCTDFFEYKSSTKAKCIIITEVLEHLENPEGFLEIAAQHLGDDGKLIVTVPFGVNNHPDHFSTFYMYTLYSLISKYFNVSYFEFLGRWMGLVAFSKDNAHQKFEINEEAIKKEELNFLSIDRQTTEQIETLTSKLKDCNEKYSRSITDYKKIKQWLEDKSKIVEKFDSELKAAKDLQDKMSKFLIEDVKLFDDQVNAMESIKQYVRKLQTQNSYLSAENQEYRRKFAKITGTWYGRILVKLYKFLQQLKRRIKGQK